MSKEKYAREAPPSFLPEGYSPAKLLSGYHKWNSRNSSAGNVIDSVGDAAGSAVNSAISGFFGDAGELLVKGISGAGEEYADAATGRAAGAAGSALGYDAGWLNDKITTMGKRFKALSGGDFDAQKQLWNSFQDEQGNIKWNKLGPLFNAFRDDEFKNKFNKQINRLNPHSKLLRKVAPGSGEGLNYGKLVSNYIQDGEFKQNKFLDGVKNLRSAAKSLRRLDPSVRNNLGGLMKYLPSGADDIYKNPVKELNKAKNKLKQFRRGYESLNKDKQKRVAESIEYLSNNDVNTEWVKKNITGGDSDTDIAEQVSKLSGYTDLLRTSEALGIDSDNLTKLYEYSKEMGSAGSPSDFNEFARGLRTKVEGMDEGALQDFKTDINTVMGSTDQNQLGIDSGEANQLVDMLGGGDRRPDEVVEAFDTADAMIQDMNTQERSAVKDSLDTMLGDEKNRKVLEKFIGDNPAKLVSGSGGAQELTDTVLKGSKIVNYLKDKGKNISNLNKTLDNIQSFMGGGDGSVDPSNMMDMVMNEEGEVDSAKFDKLINIGGRLDKIRQGVEKVKTQLGFERDEDVDLEGLGIDPEFFMEGGGIKDLNVSAIESGVGLLDSVVREMKAGNLNPEIVEDAIGGIRNLSKLGILKGPSKSGIERVKSLVTDEEGKVDSNKLATIMKFSAVGNRIYESIRSGDPEAIAALGGIGLTLAGMLSKLFGGSSRRSTQRRQFNQGILRRGAQRAAMNAPLQQRQPMQRQPRNTGRVNMYPVDWRSLPGRTVR